MIQKMKKNKNEITFYTLKAVHDYEYGVKINEKQGKYNKHSNISKTVKSTIIMMMIVNML